MEDTSFDLVISLSPEAHHKAMEMTRTMAIDVEYWPTIDPSLTAGSREQILDAYRACRDSLRKRIMDRFGGTGLPQVRA
jgi:protein-tyrosine-phosphatase